LSVIRQQTNLKRWERSVSYGYRWVAKTLFFSIKRTFCEWTNYHTYIHCQDEHLFIPANLGKTRICSRYL